MSNAARPDPVEAPEERRFLRSARDGDVKDRGKDAAPRQGHGWEGGIMGRIDQRKGMAGMEPGGIQGPPRISLERRSLKPAAANAS